VALTDVIAIQLADAPVRINDGYQFGLKKLFLFAIFIHHEFTTLVFNSFNAGLTGRQPEQKSTGWQYFSFFFPFSSSSLLFK